MNYLISDTADAVVTRKSDGHRFVTAEAQIASLESTLGINEKVYGGIGNKALSTIRGQKEVTTTLQNALFDLEMLALTQGMKVEEDGKATVFEKEEGLVVEGGSVSINGEPNGDVELRNQEGTLITVEATGGAIEVPTDFAANGTVLSAFYEVDITGEILEIKADKFSEAYKLEYHTIGYNPATNEVVVDIYIQLDHIIPQGDFELSLENGTALSPSITIDAMTAPNTSDIGRVIVRKRQNGRTTP